MPMLTLDLLASRLQLQILLVESLVQLLLLSRAATIAKHL